MSFCFCIGFARSLFYWFLFKNNFGAFRYISISSLLKKSAAQYGKSYLYTETDGMDLTYFLDHQCKMISQAISNFKESYSQAIRDMEVFNVWMYESGLLGELSGKQKVVLQVAKNRRQDKFTTSEVANNLGCSYNTAANVLNGLVEKKIFKKKKSGREWVFSMKDRKEIMYNWEN